ncbi:3333_t:CDS:2 [Funneliformis geosporum]|uniref:3333_t:CDS:1 n=1 Tax=Funneliformis geosporum TaxID=1117311 RepID=A0A9W4SD48_9GLOM|nr:3333_t:CDS:2 [Funneliformis geosporum]
MENPLLEISQASDDDIEISIQNPQEEEYLSSNVKGDEFDNSKPPHHGKEISELIVSSDLSYVVTFSQEDSSIVGWPINEQDFGELTYDAECKSEEITDILQVSNNRDVLLQVFDHNALQKTSYKIIELNPNGNKIHAVTGNPKVDDGTFVAGTNNFFMIFRDIASAYLYSNKKNHGWDIEEIYNFAFPKGINWVTRRDALKESRKIGYFLTTEKLFLTYGGCGILTQWDIATMTFEKQYFLDVEFDNLHPSTATDISLQNNPIKIEQQILFNDSKTLMAIYGFNTYNIEHQIVIYSTRSCIRYASFMMDYEANSVLRLNFIGTNKFDEGLLARERGFLFVEPSYYLNEFNGEVTQINIEQLFTYPPDNSDVEVILSRDYDNRVICCSHGKLIHYNINKDQLWKFQEKLNRRDDSQLSPIVVLKIVLELFNQIEKRQYSFTEKSFELRNIKIHWKVIHYSGSGRTQLVVYKRKRKIDEYRFFESRTGYVYACKPIYNGDLIMITKQGIMIFTIHTNNNKIQMRYFWDNDDWHNLWKVSRQLSGVYNLEDEQEPFFGATAKKELTDKEILPPLNIERIFDEYEISYISEHTRRFPFKEVLYNYLSDVVTFAEIGEGIFKMAIEMNKGNIVDLIYDLVMDNLRKDSDQYMGLLSVISSFLSQLQVDYPEVVRSYISHTSLILDHNCVEILVSDIPPFHGFTRDQHVFKNNFFPIYFKIYNFYGRFRNITRIFFRKRRIQKVQNYGKSSIVLVVPLPKFACYNTEYSFLKDLIRPETNGFIEIVSLDLGAEFEDDASSREEDKYNFTNSKSKDWWQNILPLYDPIRFNILLHYFQQLANLICPHPVFLSQENKPQICVELQLAPTLKEHKKVHKGFEDLGGLKNVIEAVDETHIFMKNASNKDPEVYFI